MKLTFENYKNFVPAKDQNLMLSLLIDLNEINNMLKDKNHDYQILFIDIQDYHDEYSSERTDPCPDYYGYYRIYTEKDPYNCIGIEMDITQLDYALCLLCNFIETELG